MLCTLGGADKYLKDLGYDPDGPRAKQMLELGEPGKGLSADDEVK